jgi:hypothetical protein
MQCLRSFLLRRELLGHKGLLVRLAPLVRLEAKGLKVCKVHKVRQAQLVPMVLLVLKVRRDLRDCKGCKVFLVRMALMAQLDHRGLKAVREFRVRKD